MGAGKVKMYEAYEPVKVIDWERGTLVNAESYYICCEEHKKWCNDGTRFKEIYAPSNMCHWCSTLGESTP